MRPNEEGPKTMSHSNFTSKDSANAAEKSALTKEINLGLDKTQG